MKPFHILFAFFLVLLLFSCHTETDSNPKFNKTEFIKMMSEWENEKPEKYSFHYEVSGFMPQIVCADVTVGGESKTCNLTQVYGKTKEQYGTENLEEYLGESDKEYCFSSFEEINNYILSCYETMDSSKCDFTLRWKSKYCYNWYMHENSKMDGIVEEIGNLGVTINISDFNLQ